MTTDINRLLASLKRRAAHAKEFGDSITFVKLKDIDALVEALEKAQQVDEELCKLLPPGAEYMDPPDGGGVTPLEGVRRMVADYLQRIAELESRTVTVKLSKDHVDDADLFGWGVVVVPLEALKDACANADVTVEISDDGIKVEAE